MGSIHVFNNFVGEIDHAHLDEEIGSVNLPPLSTKGINKLRPFRNIAVQDLEHSSQHLWAIVSLSFLLFMEDLDNWDRACRL